MIDQQNFGDAVAWQELLALVCIHIAMPRAR